MKVIDETGIESYRHSINNLAKTHSNMVFDNYGASHAAIVLAAIFHTADRSVRIFANNMDGKIGSDANYLRALREFVASGKQLKIIINSPEYFGNTKNPSPSVQFIKNNLKTGSISCKVADANFHTAVKRISGDGKLLFFTVGDQIMYRIELDNDTHQAKCCFSDEITSKNLCNFFDKYFEALPELAPVA